MNYLVILCQCLLLWSLNPTTCANELNWEAFKAANPKDEAPYAAAEAIAKLNAAVPKDYYLGPQDVIEITVWERDQLSGSHTIGPDGIITMPLLGDLQLGGLSRSAAQNLIKERMADYYRDSNVQLQITSYQNNHVYLLGRTTHAGRMPLTGEGTLLELLSTAIPYSQQGEPILLTKAMIMRDGANMIWIDLRELLVAGNLSLNLKLKNGDLIYLPNEEEPKIYIMGEVTRPGAYRLLPKMSFLDAVMGAGGVTLDGRKNHMILIRRRDDQIMRLRVRTRDMKWGDLAKNVALEENDIIYIGRKGIAHMRYIFSQLNPFASLLVIQQAIADNDD